VKSRGGSKEGTGKHDTTLEAVIASIEGKFSRKVAMSSLLTRDEYQALAESLPLPANAAIAGSTFDSINPATGEVLVKIACCGKEDVDLAVEKARRAFEAGVWSRAHPSERKRVMRRLVRLMKRNVHELAVLETLVNGKPIFDVETIDIPEALHCLEWHAEAADKIYGQTSPSGDDVVSLIVRQPLGVVACVLPWNFPIMMLAWKLGPALATGNSVIIKPAEQTNMSALWPCGSQSLLTKRAFQKAFSILSQARAK
jgi:gamma-glutamyl-gamma-aminobutyraldehyde dehydrogenase